MDITSEIGKSLRDYLPWHKARLDCFVKIIIALLTVKTINWTEWAVAFATDKANVDSCYNRIKRFFRQFIINSDTVFELLKIWFNLGQEKWFFTLDRTQWEFGKKKINILVLAVVYKQMAIPIHWKLLNKKGNSNTKERIEVMDWLLARFSPDRISGLLADREFIGGEWFGYLKKKNINFYIRIKSDFVVKQNGKEYSAWQLFLNKHKKKPIFMRDPYELLGVSLYLSGMRLDDGDLLIIASTKYDEDSLQKYSLRWQIENLFQSLKGRGFRLEDTHVTSLIKLDKLMVILTVGFAMAYKIGYWKHVEKKAIKIKKHGRPAYSLFRYGLDLIRDTLLKPKNVITSTQEWLAILFLWTPPIDFKAI